MRYTALAVGALLLATAAAWTWACTFKVEVDKVEVDKPALSVGCLVVVLPGGSEILKCPQDAEADAVGDGP